MGASSTTSNLPGVLHLFPISTHQHQPQWHPAAAKHSLTRPRPYQGPFFPTAVLAHSAPPLNTPHCTAVRDGDGGTAPTCIPSFTRLGSCRSPHPPQHLLAQQAGGTSPTVGIWECVWGWKPQ